MARRFTVGIGAVVAAVLWLAGLSHGEESPWAKFDLVTTEAGGVALRYERALEPQMADVKSAIGVYMAKEWETDARIDRIVADGTIFKEIGDLVGPPGEGSLRVPGASEFSGMARMGWVLRRVREFLVISAGSIKERMRAGDVFPNFTYDRATDQISYAPQFNLFLRGTRETGSFVLPIKEPKDAGKEVADLFAALGLIPRIGVALHEVVEMTILVRLRTGDPHIRWFSDGLGNAITIRLLERHLGKEVADSYAGGTANTGKYGDVEKDVNLAWWMSKMYAMRTSLASEDTLAGARYAYATFEAGRIIDAQGLECVRKIFDKLPAMNVTAADIIAAIRDVTGEDMEARLAQYQRFDTREKGVAVYTEAMKAADARKDYPAVLSATLRLMELQERYDTRLYGAAAQCLLRMGREDLADEVFLSQIRLMKNNKRDDLRLALEAFFCVYSLSSGKPQKAHEFAEEVLGAQPDFLPALAVRMHRLYVSAQKDDAVNTARRILELDKDGKSFFNRKANDVIAELTGTPTGTDAPQTGTQMPSTDTLLAPLPVGGS